MKLWKQHQFWISLLVGVVLFIGTYPFYHDMYIAEVFTGLCICLNALSAILFGAFLYCKWTNRRRRKNHIFMAYGYAGSWTRNFCRNELGFLPVSCLVRRRNCADRPCAFPGEKG